jgi:hypothetical protein
MEVIAQIRAFTGREFARKRLAALQKPDFASVCPLM